MRRRAGCESCRDRHTKCVKVPGSDKCRKCIQKHLQCIPSRPFRFRPVTSVKYNAGDEGVAERPLAFEGTETWVRVPPTLLFLPPNTEDELGLSTLEAEASPGSSTSVGSKLPNALESALIDDDSHSLLTDRPPVQRSPSKSPFHLAPLLHSPEVHNPRLHSSTPIEPAASHCSLPDVSSPTGSNALLGHHSHRHLSPTESNALLEYQIPDSNSPVGSNALLRDHIADTNSPNGSANALIRHQDHYTPGSIAFSISSLSRPHWPVMTTHEARIFHHYIVHCSPWVDICDPKRHFGHEVPKRAAHYPVILNGILGLAARHMQIMRLVDDDVSQPYIGNCLRSVIVALGDPLAHWDENLLTAVILLRLHEEIGDEDEKFHNLGSARLLNSISSFAADGGLRESASWVSLRQHVYVSLVTQQPLSLSLANYRHSSVFQDVHDEAWANRIIFAFAEILSHVFQEEDRHLSREMWAELDAQVEDWRSSKPWTFTPFIGDGTGGDELSGPWPELPTAHPVHAVGLQYYHLCRILLAIYDPCMSKVGLTNYRSRRTADEAIRQHIRMIIGYTTSNDHVAGAMFQGTHILAACGAYLVDPQEQEAAVQFLKSTQMKIGWLTGHIERDLREQWRI